MAHNAPIREVADSPTAPRSLPAGGGASAVPAQVFLRPIGSPVSLGLAGLFGASLVASGMDLGWIAKGEQGEVALVFLAFAVPLQLIASVLSFLGRDGAVGTSVGVLAGTWLADGLVHLSSPPGSRSGALGLLLLASAALLAAGASATALGKLLPCVTFAAAAVRFALIGVYNLGASSAWQTAGGAVGLAVVALAGYTMWSLSLEDAQDRTLLPVLRRGRGAGALTAPFADQLEGVEHEAGVRKQL